MKADSSNNTAYNKTLQPFASKLRNNFTKSESWLWKFVLKSGKMLGYHFRRQRPVLNYIADFMCIELKLIIELDGATHLLDEVIENDIIRQKALEDAGFIVLRFTDAEVLTGIEGVAERIREVIREIENR